MIKISIIDLGKYSPSCVPNCPNFEPNGCHGCTLRLYTSARCPNCDIFLGFYGVRNLPKKCNSCGQSIPDVYAMKQHEHHDVRVAYYLES